MTGEASPGYLPYPDVARLVSARMPGPRIVAIGRNPLERTYSSYRYNYATPTIQEMKRGQFYSSKGIPGGYSDEYYEQYLFSYEDMIRAELKVLRECLAVPNGRAVEGARQKWINFHWAKREYDRREREGLPPLVDLDGFCYGGLVNSTIPREQWTDLFAKYPNKVLTQRDAHVSFVGDIAF